VRVFTRLSFARYVACPGKYVVPRIKFLGGHATLTTQPIFMPSAFIIVKSTNGQFYFSLGEINHRPILLSSSFQTKRECREAIDAVKLACPLDTNYVRKTLSNAEHIFLLKTFTDVLLGHSKPFHSVSAREKAIDTLKREGTWAVIQDTCVV